VFDLIAIRTRARKDLEIGFVKECRCYSEGDIAVGMLSQTCLSGDRYRTLHSTSFLTAEAI
jgi:hypothetical protein